MASKVKLSDIVPSRFAHLTPMDEANVERIRADLESGSKILLNNPHVFREGDKYELLAGHDRVEAARRAGWTEVPVRDFSGALNTDDAILAHFCKENLLRKEVSKAAIAGEWLKKHPEWSDGKVADESGCTAPYVGAVRGELGITNPKLVSGSREGRDGKTREYKPRQVRYGPTPNRIPHPTKTVEVRPASRVDAMRAQREAEAEERERREAEQSGAPEPDSGSTGLRGTPEVGDTPTGVPAPLPEELAPALPAWIIAALAISALPLTNEQARALTAAEADRLFAVGTACTNAARRAKLARENSEAA